jgi:3-hydroxyisobutyrate dehydrogenase-like beta-hydroxyacid dehydrogenase
VRVGFVGLGTMGATMARNLVERGHDLVVHDARAEAADPLVSAGAVAAGSASEVAAAVDLVLTSLPGPVEVAAVATGVDGILAGAAPGMVHLDLSTNSWDVVRDLAERYATRGMTFLDAPVSGGPAGAAARKLAVWVGGDPAGYERARPVLTDLADRVARVGDVGAGTVVKLAHNATGNAMNLLFAELFTLADRAGVDPLTLWRNVREGAVGRRRTYDGLAAHFLPQRYDPAALSLMLARKDTQLLVELADAVGAEVPRIAEILARMEEATARGWGDRDSRVTMLQEQERVDRLLTPVPEDEIAAVFAADPPAGPDVRTPPMSDGR